MSNLGNSLWYEKYRPQTFDDYVGNEDFVGKVRKWIAEGDVPSLLLHSVSPGSGKTTAAKIIGRELDADVMYINASDENNIETVRDKIKTFASSVGFSRWKIIILDECLKFDSLIHILRNGESLLIPICELNDKLDLVLSYNIETNSVEYQPFDLKDVGQRRIYKIELENGEIIECSENHKWYVYNDKNELIVVNASELNNFDHIVSPQ